MISFHPNGSVFEVQSGYLVCPVNTVGRMGAGLAKDFASRVPQLELRYRAECVSGALELVDDPVAPEGLRASCGIYMDPSPETHLMPGLDALWRANPNWNPYVGRIIACLPTKRHWRAPSELRFVRAAVRDFVEFLRSKNLVHGRPLIPIAVPMLGCGLGGLDWRDVRPILLEEFDLLRFFYEIRIYGAPA